MPETSGPHLADAHDLLAFIRASPSPFHVVAEATRRLQAGGFVEVHETDSWPMAPGRHYLTRGGSLVAWVGDAGAAAGGDGFRVIGAHTDSPNLRVKPRPDTGRAGWRQLGVEFYGGVLLNSWLDRDLGLSGRVTVLEGSSSSPSEPVTRLFRDDRALLRIPQLAIHLDREITQNGLKLNPQQHLVPTWGLGSPEPGAFVRYLAHQIGVDADAVVSWDVMTHDIQPGTLAGIDGELVSTARLDNQLSCWAALQALLDVAPGDQGVGPGAVAVVVLFDHEEIGSTSSSGADSDLLPTALERIVHAGGGDRDAFLRAIAASRCISADGAHATHPNYAERHEPDHPVALNAGPVLKHNANVRYATDAVTAAWFEAACRAVDVPVQHFVSRVDMPCGSTIGPITAGRLGIPTVDVGVAQLAMHSSRELCGSADPAWFRQALGSFLLHPHHR
ncbi:MAG: M18 family aminopeptidase [Acidimicrobiales bacterium]